MPPGPRPDPDARRRNTPTIPTTKLPVGGRKGRPPKVPEPYELGKAGQTWWKWAWGLPQAHAWDAGALYTLARRAQLEDNIAALGEFDPQALSRLFDGIDVGDPDSFLDILDGVSHVIGRLKSLAGGELAVMKEIRELDGKLGLNPKALADLRWTIVAEADDEKAGAAKSTGRRRTPTSSRRARLSVVS